MAELTRDALVENIQSSDHRVRAAARDAAGSVGAQAVAPLAQISGTAELEIARAAQRAMQNIVYHAGRPGAEPEAQAVATALVALLDASHPLDVRRDALWMIWQIAGDQAVEPVAALLGDAELGEDARMTLERLPGDKATAALQAALDGASNAQKAAVAHSLRVRGVKTPGAPDLRLEPTKTTSVEPVGRAAGPPQG